MASPGLSIKKLIVGCSSVSAGETAMSENEHGKLEWGEGAENLRIARPAGTGQ